MQDDRLAIWVVCRNPADYPGKFTVRRQWPTAKGIIFDDEVMACDRLITIRRRMISMGLYRLPRQPGDSPVILETWL